MGLPIPKSAIALMLRSAGVDGDFIQNLTQNVESFIRGGATEIQAAMETIRRVETKIDDLTLQVQELKTLVLRCDGLPQKEEVK